MNFLRFVFFLLILAVVILAVVSIASLTPIVQTWVAQSKLDHQPGVHSTLGSVWTAFGQFEVEDLRLERDGYVLTLPSLEARLPVSKAVLYRRVEIKSLVAKGWILDLSRTPDLDAPAPTPTLTPPAENKETADSPTASDATDSATKNPELPADKVVSVFRGVLDAWQIPADVSLDGVDLEGDVRLSAGAGEKPVQVHLRIRGGGFDVGKAGTLSIDAETSLLDSHQQPIFVTAQMHLTGLLNETHKWERLALSTDLVIKGGALPENLNFLVNASAARGVGEEIYRLDWQRDGRHLESWLLHFPEATHRLAGTWKIDLRDTDVALLFGETPAPILAVQGEGDAETDLAFEKIHFRGHVNTTASRLEGWAPLLKKLSSVSLDTRFDLTESNHRLHFDNLTVSLAGADPTMVAQSIHPIDFDATTGVITTAETESDWLKILVNRFPLKTFSGLVGDFAFNTGTVSGELIGHSNKDGFSLHTKSPLIANGASLYKKGRMIGEGLDLSLNLLADYNNAGWKLQWSPLTASKAGHPLFTMEGSAEASPAADSAVALTGKWNADFGALNHDPGLAGAHLMRVRSASGDFSGSVAASTKGEGNFLFLGEEPNHSFSLKWGVNIDTTGTVAVRAPVKIIWGSQVSDVIVDGTIKSSPAGTGVDLSLAGKAADLEPLRWAGEQVMMAGNDHIGGANPNEQHPPSMDENARDTTPFWRKWFGHLTLAFNQLRVDNKDFKEVAAAIYIEPGALRLSSGRYLGEDGNLIPVEAKVTFDPAIAFPYNLRGSVAPSIIDAGPFFGIPPEGQDAVFEGKVSITSTISGRGVNFNDLVAHTQQEFHLKSTSGIVRLLKTDISSSIPPPDTAISDTMTTVGSAVGSIFGTKHFGTGEIHLRKNTQSVIDFTFNVAEIGYKEIALTATRGFDQSIHVTDLSMTSDDAHVTGTGEIAFVEGKPFRSWPLNFDFKFAARGKAAELLANAALLSGQKDSQGFSLLNEDFHFGGNLQHVDNSNWHDLLAKAALAKPIAAGKSTLPQSDKK